MNEHQDAVLLCIAGNRPAEIPTGVNPVFIDLKQYVAGPQAALFRLSVIPDTLYD
ncbi:MAG: hypothetical protein MZV63_16190 [Marinilabiliales bacterium]|nr:hypothetical protein [Marinilabiliales bacterium]